jgi:ribokinase
MGAVTSFGSINVDRVVEVTTESVESYAERYDWFPDRGETVTRTELPEGFDPDPDELEHGGKGANQAVAASAAGADAALFGNVGPDHDEFGVLESLRDVGVAIDGVATVAEPTGTAFVFVGPDGDNRIVVRPGANAAVDRNYAQTVLGDVRDADCLLLQNEVPTDAMTELLGALADAAERPTVVLDPAPAERIEPLLDTGVVDYLTPNETEYESIRSHLGAFDGVLVVTRGEAGVEVHADRTFTVTPPTVETVDTTGAGDVFNGYLAAGLTAGDSLRTAVERGVVAGALSTRTVGARASIPTSEEVQAFQS